MHFDLPFSFSNPHSILTFRRFSFNLFSTESEHSCPPKQTSPRQNVYPTWTKEFVFPGLSKTTLMEGGIEVILYDYHRLHSNVNIGGIRLCIPQLASPVVSPESLAREASLILFGQSAKRDCECENHTQVSAPVDANSRCNTYTPTFCSTCTCLHHIYTPTCMTVFTAYTYRVFHNQGKLFIN